MRILVTGATGYVGGHLIPQLLEGGHRVRVLVREPQGIHGRAWARRVEVFRGDLLLPDTLTGLCDGVDRAYYLVHCMCAGADFVNRDLRAAANYVGAAGSVGLTVYLGGLVPPGCASSSHLGSRSRVGALLRSALPTTEIRAGPIIGSGSASFELVRYLTERLPVMLAPRCAENAVQPIALPDLLAYLLGALRHEGLDVVEVGGEPLSFRRMMLVYAAVRGLPRVVVCVPGVTPKLVARWVALVTPVPPRIAGPLLQGMLRPVVADTSRAAASFPEVRPLGYRRAVELALERGGEVPVDVHRAGAPGSGSTRERLDREGLLGEVRTEHVRARPERVHEVLAALVREGQRLGCKGGSRLLAATEGQPRGFRPGGSTGAPRELSPTEAVGPRQREGAEQPFLLRVRPETTVTGQAWLEWQARAEARGTRLVQTALFRPCGLTEALGWYVLYPFHSARWGRLARAVVRRSEEGAAERGTSSRRYLW